MILAIDPGNVESAYAVLDRDLKPVEFGKLDNQDILRMIRNGEFTSAAGIDSFAIEMIASYGMAVGKTVFDTCVWIGRFEQAMLDVDGITADYVYRKQVTMNLCGSARAKDGNVRQALIDRFGAVGVKANKGWFYGVSKDVWSAIAVGVTYADMKGVRI